MDTTEAVHTAHLSVFQWNDPWIFCGTDDVIIIANPLDGPLSKTLDTVRLRRYAHTKTHRWWEKYENIQLRLILWYFKDMSVWWLD